MSFQNAAKALSSLILFLFCYLVSKRRLGAYNNLELATSNSKLAATSNLQYTPVAVYITYKMLLII